MSCRYRITLPKENYSGTSSFASRITFISTISILTHIYPSRVHRFVALRKPEIYSLQFAKFCRKTLTKRKVSSKLLRSSYIASKTASMLSTSTWNCCWNLTENCVFFSLYNWTNRKHTFLLNLCQIKTLHSKMCKQSCQNMQSTANRILLAHQLDSILHVFNVYLIYLKYLPLIGVSSHVTTWKILSEVCTLALLGINCAANTGKGTGTLATLHIQYLPQMFSFPWNETEYRRILFGIFGIIWLSCRFPGIFIK